VIKRAFIYIDKRLNYLSGGSINNTISGRTGYYANNANSYTRWYWLILEIIIDSTFYPLDGYNHCLDSYINDKSKGDYKPTKFVVFFFLLSLFAVSACVVLILPFYALYVLGIFNTKNI